MLCISGPGTKLTLEGDGELYGSALFWNLNTASMDGVSSEDAGVRVSDGGRFVCQGVSLRVAGGMEAMLLHVSGAETQPDGVWSVADLRDCHLACF